MRRLLWLAALAVVVIIIWLGIGASCNYKIPSEGTCQSLGFDWNYHRMDNYVPTPEPDECRAQTPLWEQILNDPCD